MEQLTLNVKSHSAPSFLSSADSITLFRSRNRSLLEDICFYISKGNQENMPTERTKCVSKLGHKNFTRQMDSYASREYRYTRNIETRIISMDNSFLLQQMVTLKNSNLPYVFKRLEDECHRIIVTCSYLMCIAHRCDWMR